MGYPFHRHGFSSISNTDYKKSSALSCTSSAQKKSGAVFLHRTAIKIAFPILVSLDITNSELSFILFFLTKTSDKPRRKLDKGESNQFIYI